jgi:hypothetical protein
MVDDDFSPRFKYRRIKRKSKYWENNTDPTYIGRTRFGNILLSFWPSGLFQFVPTQADITGIITVPLGFAGVYFFIQQYITKRDKILQKRQQHFEKLESISRVSEKTRACRHYSAHNVRSIYSIKASSLS